ncbi:sterol desaturase family protein [Patulibacter sp. SYSU D01012]|uniref:sterol desaturase family protein n=1 Tax=Patulibacter sp. SYSU D01012 TaxID=2817381 RepID=UPI0032C09C78
MSRAPHESDPSESLPPRVTRTTVLRASPPMFRTVTVDRLTRVHPAVPLVVFLPVVVLQSALALRADDRVGTFALLFALGFALWGLVEYWVHRVVFHIEPEEGFGARLHWMVHGVHHDHPNDPLRLVMPPAVSVPGIALFTLLFALALGTGAGLAVAAGFTLGYVVYDTTHHHLHHHRPRTRAGRWLREAHMRHHFQDDHAGFGISSPWWDVVFRTLPRKGGNKARRG